MRELLRGFSLVVLLGFSTIASAQLPPKIMADKHLIHAELLYAAKELCGSLQSDGKGHRVATRARSYIVGRILLQVCTGGLGSRFHPDRA